MQTQPHPIDVVAWESDPQTFRFRYVSAAAERLLGFPLDEWLEPGFFADRLHPDDRDRVLEECRRATEAGDDHRMTYRLVDVRGREVWVEDDVEVVFEGGEIVALRGVLVDSTAHRRDEATARFLVENSSDIITMLEPTGEIRYVSPAGERVLGFATHDVIGRNGFEYIHPDDREKARRELDIALGTPGFTEPIQLRFCHADGSWRLLECISRTIAGGTVLVSARDITMQRRETEAHKMEALGRLASSIAHDFNNILFVIKGLGELLAPELHGMHAERLQELLGAADRGTMLTRQLLSFGNRNLAQGPSCDAASAIERFTAMVGSMLANSGVRLHTSAAPGLPAVAMPCGELEQTLLNLVLNARDAMPDGGHIGIAADRAGDTVRIRVTDTGAGMDEQTRSRVFEPYFTTKDETSGTGLGLATVFAAVSQRGGEIDVESTLGVGTTFEVRIPVATARPARILVVDDDPVIRGIVSRALEAEGYDVVVDVAAGPFDVVITDVNLDNALGTDLAMSLLNEHPGLRVVFMTGLGSLPPAAAEIAEAVLEKPFSLDLLRSEVARVVASVR